MENNKKEILNYIKEQLSDSGEWVFISKKQVADKTHTCVFPPDKSQALRCVMGWLINDKQSWNALKETIDSHSKNINNCRQ